MVSHNLATLCFKIIVARGPERYGATVNEQIAVQNILRERFTEIRRQNPRYSLRAYAKRVGVHVGALTHIINGKRNVSRRLAERISHGLLLDPHKRAELLTLFPKKKTPSGKGSSLSEPRYLELSGEQFKIASEWEHFAKIEDDREQRKVLEAYLDQGRGE